MSGMGTSNSSQQTSQSGTTAPWAPTQPILNNILGGIGGISASPNAAQTQGAQGLVNAAGSLPNYGSQASNGVNSLLGSLPQGVQDAYKTYQGQIGGIANQNNDPMQTPGMANILSTIQSDVGNSVNSQFAGAGRDLSGMNQQALARGISQGEAPALLGQYNQNVAAQTGAAGNLFGAAGTNANTQAGLYGAGMQGAGQIPGLYSQNSNALLNAGNTQAGLPAQNLGMLEGLTLPIAGLGSQSTGTGSSSGQQTMSPIQQLMGLSSGLFGNSGALGGVQKFFSDRRLKRDIERVGTLFDGTPVYRYRYLGDGAMQIGLMSDEVIPAAVTQIKGYDAVDYAMATARALEMAVV